MHTFGMVVLNIAQMKVMQKCIISDSPRCRNWSLDSLQPESFTVATLLGFIETRFSATELKRFITSLQPRGRHVMNRKHSQEHHYPRVPSVQLCTHSSDFICGHMECVTSCWWGKPFWYRCEGEGDLAPLSHTCW